MRRGTGPRRIGLARAISKRGVCSRSQAEAHVRAGRVTLDGRVERDPWAPTREGLSRIAIDGIDIATAAPVHHLMLNKPRGLVTSARDERGRDTVYRCFDGAAIDGRPLGWIAPVGRLDKASEGLLLFTNDPAWAARITDPATGPAKTYHVQVDVVPDAALLARIAGGVVVDGETLAVSQVAVLRAGQRQAWLEIVLDAGRNRHIRRLLAAFDIGVLRLVRVAIGPLALGPLPKGRWRTLTPAEVASLRS